VRSLWNPADTVGNISRVEATEERRRGAETHRFGRRSYVPANVSTVRAVVFDMDGTLTESPLDFDRIRAECGIPPGEPVLEYIDRAPESHRGRLERILRTHERRAALACTVRDGATDVLEELRRRGYRTALLTRNSRQSVEVVLDRFGWTFDCWVSREQGQPKPSPDALRKIACTLGLATADLLMVGDYLFDVAAGRAAGARTAFLRTGKNIPPPPDADFVLSEIEELLDVLPQRAAGEGT
jgi:HAD superfamily hydrolase (TIGR01509 family)